MQYKTTSENEKFMSIWAIVLGFSAMVTCWIIGEGESIPILVGVYCMLAGICVFLRCWLDRWYREQYYINGERINAYVAEAEWLMTRTGEDTYFLFIEFYENNEKKVRKTQGYVGSPNDILRSTKCSIYKWKGKYMEGDFETRDMGESGHLNIPIIPHRYMLMGRRRR